MINENHIKFWAVAYFVLSYLTSFALFATQENHWMLLGLSIFAWNNYQLATEFFYRQNDES